MKVIDLLNKIANKEDVPEKIKFADNIYELKHNVNHLYNYMDKHCDYFEDDWYLFNKLNDEIEIIEDTPREDKKICYVDITGLTTAEIIIKFAIKINEIIDKINGDSDE